MNKDTKFCWNCNTEKPLSAFGIRKTGKNAGKPTHPCLECRNALKRQWKQDHPDKYQERQARYNQHRRERPGHTQMADNPKCTLYLGYFISETVLSREFKNVKRMPVTHPGYDFECNRHFKIDAKSSCLVNASRGGSYWQFTIKCNKVPHFYLLIAWDNRDNLNPIHIWLIPAALINMKKIIYIGNTEKSLAKWKKYERPLTNVLSCCKTMRAKKLLEEDIEEVLHL